MPHRVQLSRAKGWRKPDNTVVVSRPARWKNIFRWTDYVQPWRDERAAKQMAVDAFRDWVTPHADLVREELAGKNLACWCKPDEPCHADVLLALANGPIDPAAERE